MALGKVRRGRERVVPQGGEGIVAPKIILQGGSIDIERERRGGVVLGQKKTEGSACRKKLIVAPFPSGEKRLFAEESKRERGAP